MGRIEKHILIWAASWRETHRHHNGERRRFFFNQSAALRSYAVAVLGFDIPRMPQKIKEHLPEKVYRRLHASFSRATRSLEGKGLVERADRGSLIGQELTLASENRGTGYRGARRDAYFALTNEGHKLAGRLHRQSKSAKPSE